MDTLAGGCKTGRSFDFRKPWRGCTGTREAGRGKLSGAGYGHHLSANPAVSIIVGSVAKWLLLHGESHKRRFRILGGQGSGRFSGALGPQSQAPVPQPFVELLASELVVPSGQGTKGNVCGIL